jgi:hypothetical protein
MATYEDTMTLQRSDRAPRVGVTRVTPTARLADVLALPAQLTGVLTYAVVAIATVWGPTSGTWSAALSGGGRIHGVATLVVAALELFGAIALFDADLAALASAVLSAVMLGAVVVAAALHVPVVGAATLLAAASLVAWATHADTTAAGE